MPLGKCSASVDRVTELSGVSLSGGSRPPRVPCRHQGGCTHRKSWPARKFNQTAGWVSLHSLPEMGMLSWPLPYGVPISPSPGRVSGGALCVFEWRVGASTGHSSPLARGAPRVLPGSENIDHPCDAVAVDTHSEHVAPGGLFERL